MSGLRVYQALGPIAGGKSCCENLSNASILQSQLPIRRWIEHILSSLTCLLTQPNMSATWQARNR